MYINFSFLRKILDFKNNQEKQNVNIRQGACQESSFILNGWDILTVIVISTSYEYHPHVDRSAVGTSMYVPTIGKQHIAGKPSSMRHETVWLVSYEAKKFAVWTICA